MFSSTSDLQQSPPTNEAWLETSGVKQWQPQNLVLRWQLGDLWCEHGSEHFAIANCDARPGICRRSRMCVSAGPRVHDTHRVRQIPSPATGHEIEPGAVCPSLLDAGSGCISVLVWGELQTLWQWSLFCWKNRGATNLSPFRLCCALAAVTSWFWDGIEPVILQMSNKCLLCNRFTFASLCPVVTADLPELIGSASLAFLLRLPDLHTDLCHALCSDVVKFSEMFRVIRCEPVLRLSWH